MGTKTAPPGGSRLGRRRGTRWWLAAVLSVVALAVALLIARPWLEGRYFEWSAKRLLQRNHPAQALEQLERTGAARNARPSTLFLMARAQRRLGQLEQASALLEEAEQRGYPAEKVTRERWLLAAQSGAIREEESHQRKLFSDPRGEEHEIGEAFVRGFRTAKRYQRAAEILDAWEADFPAAAQPHFLRGLLWQDAGFPDRAEAALRRAVDRQPDHPEASLALAELLQDQQAFTPALGVLEAFLQNDPQNFRARVLRAGCLRQVGRTDEARQLLIQLEVAGSSSELGFEWGALEFACGNYEKAVSWLQAAHAAAPANLRIRRQLALALAGAKKHHEADPHFAALERAHLQHHRIKELSASVFANNGDPAPRVELAKQLLETGSDQEAIHWLYSALEVDPRFAGAHQLLAEYYERHQHSSSQFADLARQHRTILRAIQGT